MAGFMPKLETPLSAREEQATPTPIKEEQVFYDQSRSNMAFCSAPQTCVRWLRVGGREAIAAAGSGDGHMDTLTFYGVWMDGEGLQHAVRRVAPHEGKVVALDVGSDGLIAVGSAHGSVRVLRSDDWFDSELTEIGNLHHVRQRDEGVVGVVALGDRVCVAGEYGSICMLGVDAKPNSGEHLAWGEQFDEVGLQALAIVDEGAHQVVAAGGSGVTVWDVRNGSVGSRLEHPSRQVATAVTVDSTQPHFILAGFRNGEVCTWDRRAGNTEPVTRAVIHDGPVWDLRVITCSRPGRLITCGEDGMVILVDYAVAAARKSAEGWSGSGEFWRATVGSGDVHSLIGKSKSALGVNGVDAHSSAELFAYAGDSAVVGFGTVAYPLV